MLRYIVKSRVTSKTTNNNIAYLVYCDIDNSKYNNVHKIRSQHCNCLLLKLQQLQFLFWQRSKYELGQSANESKYSVRRLSHDDRVWARGHYTACK